ncbi:MAG TPA: 2-oxoacid:acceptor oxidoreductase family protein [Alphaproteobacteria bacterium]|nr:2-oxoacid:acceptor oxidoreductase family protein [Alphaproteobacteria bacterium]
MLRIRFHGRGGQGMKTASRIVGSAAFWEGRYAQDAPIYGAERRGAPMTAYTRIADEPILERGVIASPDLVVVADATLLDDPQVRPLHGLPPTGTVLINAVVSPAALRESHAIVGPLAVLDATELTLTHLGSLAGLSVALGGATCRLAGLGEESLEHAVRAELTALGIESERIEKNVGLARLCYTQLPTPLPPPAIATAPMVPAPPLNVVTPHYEGALRGAPSVTATPNTPLRQTGNWRVWRPVIDLARCTQCWMCFVSCPDGAISLDHADNPHIDYDVCKGCLICVEECPTHTIHKVREAEV